MAISPLCKSSSEKRSAIVPTSTGITAKTIIAAVPEPAAAAMVAGLAGSKLISQGLLIQAVLAGDIDEEGIPVVFQYLHRLGALL